MRTTLVLFVLVLGLAVGAADNPTLQDRIWRGNVARTGEFTAPGPQALPKVKWSFATGGPVQSSPVVADGLVHIGSDDGIIYALDLATGKERWRFAVGGPTRASAAVFAGKVFYTGPKGVFALDAATGAKAWHRPGGFWDDSPLVIPGPIKHKDGKTLDGIVFYSQPWNNLVGLDIADGGEVWRCRDGHGPGSRGNSALVHRGLITYFRGSQATVLVDVLTERRKYEIDGAIDNGVFTPAARDGICYSYIKGIVAFDMLENAAIDAKSWADYRMKWRFDPGREKGWDYQHPGISSLSVDDRSVYFGHIDTFVYALDRETGAVRWQTRTGGVNRSSPALGSGALLFLGSYNGNVYGIAKDDGAIRWQLPLGGPVHSSPALVGKTLVIGCDNGSVYALE